MNHNGLGCPEQLPLEVQVVPTPPFADESWWDLLDGV